MKRKTIPTAVVRALGLSEEMAQHIRLLGAYQGREAYHFAIPDAITGFPSVLLFDGTIVEELQPDEAFEVIELFVKY